VITRWILVLALAMPAMAAPDALNARQLKAADAKATSLFVNVEDKDIRRLERFKSLTELRFTGPYDDGC